MSDYADDRCITISMNGPDGEPFTTRPISLNDMKRATKAIERGEISMNEIRKAAKFPKEPTPMFSEKETGEAASETVAAAELRQIIERVERLEEEKIALQDDIKEVMAEAKGRGYDTKAIRTIIRLRKKDPNQRQEEEALVELYMTALGMA